MPKEQDQLLREIDAPIQPRAFDALTFTSTTRAEAIMHLRLRDHRAKDLDTGKAKARAGSIKHPDELLRITFHTGKFMVVTGV